MAIATITRRNAIRTLLEMAAARYVMRPDLSFPTDHPAPSTR